MARAAASPLTIPPKAPPRADTQAPQAPLRGAFCGYARQALLEAAAVNRGSEDAFPSIALDACYDGPVLS